MERGVDVTLFAAADSVTSATLVGTIPTGYSEDAELDAKVWEGLHIATVFERAGGVRPDPQQRRLPAARRTAGWSTRPSSPRSTGSRPRRSCRSSSATTIVGTTSRSATPTVIRSCTTRPRSITASRWTRSHSIEAAGDYLLFFGRIHPHKGAAEAIEVAARVGVPLTIAGIVQDRTYFERCGGAAHRRRTRALHRLGRTRRARRGAGRRARAAAPHLVRGTVRVQRDRVDGVRHAGGRHAARFDARARAARCERLPGGYARARRSTRCGQ